ncbi:MAG: PhzF family phenazine biosynthesis isomerase [Gammaproteobacteria bacterium]|nr:PhzF family phenazine biosynthesis isomerase [Gammaproteobacteria bacterium]
MKKYRLYQVDAFTDKKFSGNPAGVVPDASGLTEGQMQTIARELNNSETAFVFPPDAGDHDVHVRFFTPTVEVPTCGHATVAAHFVRAMELNLDKVTVKHKCGIGVLDIHIDKTSGKYVIRMDQPVLGIGNEISADEKRRVLGALGISAGDLDERCPLHVVDTGNNKLIVGLKSRALLNSLTPDFKSLADLGHHFNCSGFFIFTLDSDDPAVYTHCRMFGPQIGIPEDPVTGNGNGPLGVYLALHGLVGIENGKASFRSRQGEAMERPGEIDVEVVLENETPVGVSVSGSAVVAFTTELEI